MYTSCRRLHIFMMACIFYERSLLPLRIATRNSSDAPKMNASLTLKMPFFAKDTRHSKNSEILKTCGASLRKMTLLRTLDENRNSWIGREIQFHYQYSRRVTNAKYPRCIKNECIVNSESAIFQRY